MLWRLYGFGGRRLDPLLSLNPISQYLLLALPLFFKRLLLSLVLIFKLLGRNVLGRLRLLLALECLFLRGSSIRWLGLLALLLLLDAFLLFEALLFLPLLLLLDSLLLLEPLLFLPLLLLRVSPPATRRILRRGGDKRRERA